MKNVATACTNNRNDRGAALVMVLLLVAVMSLAAVASFEATGFAIKRTTASRMYDQARHYAIGAEHIARVAAERLTTTDQALLRIIGFDGDSSISYPIEGGLVEGQITDASNCFNVNSLVQLNGGGVLNANESALIQYQYLLELAGLSEAQAEHLSATLVDWLDSDSRQSPRGAEDYDYAVYNPPYRTANTLMVDLSELRLVAGYDSGILNSIAPFLCALPTPAPASLNVNSLRPQDGILLAALVGRAVSLQQMQGLIAERDARGYETVSDFWSSAVFNGLSVNQGVRGAVDVKPSRFLAQIHVQHFDADLFVTSYLWTGLGGKTRVLSRSFGAIQ